MVRANVRYWHLADIAGALHMSAFDPKRALGLDLEQRSVPARDQALSSY
jgi:hypothetical protein